jgi:DNA primase
MRYDPDTIERIKEASDIVDVVGRHVELKRSGSSFKGLCPFHQEKTPSFMVNPGRQIFHCFGCDTGGDVIRFLMLFEGLPFTDALKKLAVQAGVDLPEPASGHGISRDEKDLLYKANRIAADYYTECLMKTSEGQKARDYFAGRGIHSEVSRDYGIGYAPDGWRNIAGRLKREGISDKTGISAGLMIEGERSKGPYDRFRNRVVFPIRDLSGRVLGFGGRVLGEELPKYINSPETPIYRKGDSLFGLDVAAPHVREKGEVILVEGYLDVISLYQAGVRNVVGVLGTALTEDHAKRIRRFSVRCVLLFDSDEAGRRAALRSGLVLMGEGLECRVAPLDPGEDPDSQLRKKGKDDILGRIAASEDIVGYALKEARVKHSSNKIGDRFQVIDAIIPYLVKIKDRAKLGAYLKWIGDELRVEQHDLRARLASLKDTRESRDSVDDTPRATRRDCLLLHILIRDPDTVEKARASIKPQDIENPEIAELVEKIFSGVNLTVLLGTVDDRWKDNLSRWALEDPVEGTEKALDDLLIHYARKRLENRIRHTRDRLTEAVRRGAEEETRELNEEWKQLQAELGRLKKAHGRQLRTGENNTSGGEDRE